MGADKVRVRLFRLKVRMYVVSNQQRLRITGWLPVAFQLGQSSRLALLKVSEHRKRHVLEVRIMTVVVTFRQLHRCSRRCRFGRLPLGCHRVLPPLLPVFLALILAVLGVPQPFLFPLRGFVLALA